jgi:hypothetical protein
LRSKSDYETILGDPGWGKTVLAAGFLEQMLSEKPHPGVCETVYYFFRHDDLVQATLDSAYRAALAQLLHRHHEDAEFLNMLLFVKHDTLSLDQSRASWNEVESMIIACGRYFGGLSLVLDGLDESADPEGLGAALRNLALESPTKIMGFSRPNINALQNLVLPDHQITLDRTHTSADICLYLQNSLKMLIDKDMLHITDSNRVVEHLAHGADGTFLWAKLMINLLKSPTLTPQARLHTISSVTFAEGLDTMYNRILSQIYESRVVDREIAQGTLHWMTHSFDLGAGSSHASELRSFLSGEVNYEEHPDEDFASMVITACRGLVEYATPHMLTSRDLDSNTGSPRIAFVHPSVRQYFVEDNTEKTAVFSQVVLDVIPGQMDISLRCIQYLSAHAPTKIPSRFVGCWDNKMDQNFSSCGNFAAYCARYWTVHLSQSIKYDPRGSASMDEIRSKGSALALGLSQYLKNPMAVVAWLEAAYILQLDVEAQVHTLQRWISSMSIMKWFDTSIEEIRSLAKAISDLADEVKAIDQKWGSELLRSPSIIWDDVATFQKNGILSRIRQPASTFSMTYLTPAESATKKLHSSKSLCTISATAGDGSVMAVLSVWPSAAFGKMASTVARGTAYRDAERCSHGWIARYELWTVKDRTRQRSYQVALEPTEILLLLRQSFRQDLDKDWSQGKFETSFPLAIAHDCNRFAVLRTVYQIPEDPLSDGTEPVACKIPLHFLQYYEQKWAVEKIPTYDPKPKDESKVNELSMLGIRDWYAYSISFDTTGSYLSFSDYQKPCITHIAIFRLSRLPDLNVEYVRSVRSTIAPPRPNLEVFHPSLPLFAFYAGFEVWVWEYTKCELLMTILLPILAVGYNRTPLSRVLLQ